jgi:hypothetical protein
MRIYAVEVSIGSCIAKVLEVVDELPFVFIYLLYASYTPLWDRLYNYMAIA